MLKKSPFTGEGLACSPGTRGKENSQEGLLPIQRLVFHFATSLGFTSEDSTLITTLEKQEGVWESQVCVSYLKALFIPSILLSTGRSDRLPLFPVTPVSAAGSLRPAPCSHSQPVKVLFGNSFKLPLCSLREAQFSVSVLHSPFARFQREAACGQFIPNRSCTNITPPL